MYTKHVSQSYMIFVTDIVCGAKKSCGSLLFHMLPKDRKVLMDYILKGPYGLYFERSLWINMYYRSLSQVKPG